jgi:hypothetical protein
MHKKPKTPNTSSTYRGVHKYDNKWRASITHNNVYHHLGVFADEKDAALAHDTKAIELFGDDACLNFPEMVGKPKPPRTFLPKNPNASSQYYGVSYKKSHKRWRASITHKKVCYRLGSFVEEQDAARAYDAKAIELLGDAARLNFPRITETTSPSM